LTFNIDGVAERAAQKALEESEDRYRDLVEHIHDLVGTHDLNGRILSINRAGREAVGVDEETLLKGNLRDFLAPEVRGRFQDYLAAIRRDGRTTGLMVVVTQGGARRVWEYDNTLRTDGVGEPIVRSMARDVTEKRRIEAALRESEARYRSFFETDLAGDYVSTPEGKILDCNPAFARLLGFESVGAALSADAASLYPASDDRERFLSRLRHEKALQNVETELSRRDGARITVLENVVGIFDSQGRLVRLFGFMFDITERKAAEKEKERLRAQLAEAQKMESVGRLAGGVAHDFNNALTVIMGHAAQALERDGREEPLHGHLEEIQKAAQRSADLTGQLLAFARRQAVVPVVLDLNRMVEDLFEMLRRLIGEEIDLTWNPGAGIRTVEIDPSQISQLLTNLCVNARDAIAGVGKVTIETSNVSLDEAACSSCPGSSAGDYVRLAVSDSGAGMGKDVLEHLFEPFYTTKALGRGTGLGLATVYGIVKQNQGFINVTSDPGEGSTFEIHLLASPKDAVQAEARGAEEAPRGRGETVLLVEDELPVLRLGEAMLVQLGYAVLSAGTPSEAMHKAETHPGAIEILVTDVVMPEMNGRDLADRMRAIRPKMRALFVSGYTADIIARRGVLNEGIRFLQKPFSASDLAFKVREALDEGEGPVTDVDEGVVRAAGRPPPDGSAVGLLAEAPPPRPPESERAKGRRVLYVDDDPQLVELMLRVLRRLGHDVTGSTDPSAALEEFRRRPDDFDAVVTDLAMPGLPGLELTRRLLAVRADVPVVVISGYVSEEDETAARVAGARAVLVKSSTVEELGSMLDRVLRAFNSE
jgi:PAS domain S-box-containing protein